MVKRFDVAIVGAGMTGLALAVALGRQDISTVIIDKADLTQQQLPEFDGRVSAISLGSQRILQNIGVWDAMFAHAEPIKDICVHEAGGFGQVHYDHRNAGNEPMGHIIENRHTRTALLAEVKKHQSVTVMAPDLLQETARVEGGVTLTLESGDSVQASLLVAADGKFSRLRQWAEIDVIERDYKQTAIVATISHEKPHKGVALERFFANGPFAVLPMQGNRASLVWVEPTATAKAICALPAQEVLVYLKDKLQSYLGEVKLETRLWSYPLTAVLAKEYTADRFALLGDAAHGMHPIAGQGVNLGFRDVAVLEEVIVQALAAGEDIGSAGVLARYQKWRRFDATAMLAATDGLNSLFSNSSTILSLARNTGFALVNQWPSLRDSFMRHAMGTEGDLPKLAKAVLHK
ncbi:MAG: UbiH/UbiF/VisC/COQ6 family ubiquinone biosynthesis hydroxylase [Rickettsiales bacterium]|nr:UbiH/UbiF/VisC/COQ6 family ubiquinone biosynthesis hydroxylase [Rickettsiales bacterium]